MQIEIWLEKDALAGVFMPVTSKYDIPLMVTRGYPSLSFLHASAKALKDGAIIYIFSDYDAAGAGIDRNIEKGLREFSEKQIMVERVMLFERAGGRMGPAYPCSRRRRTKSMGTNSVASWTLLLR